MTSSIATLPRIGIIVGSTRPNRKAYDVAAWALELARTRSDASFELLDLADYPLPHLDEPWPPSLGRYHSEHTRQWAEAVDSFDGYVIVTPEYNHSLPGALKDALDFVFAEWNNKAVGFISYGAHGGTRAVEHLRGIAGELMMADVRAQVVLPTVTEFQDRRIFTPGAYNTPVLQLMLDQVIAWTTALAPLRTRHADASDAQAIVLEPKVGTAP